MIRRPPRSTLDRSSAASDVYKRQGHVHPFHSHVVIEIPEPQNPVAALAVFREAVGVAALIAGELREHVQLSLIHISEPNRPY